MQKHIVAFTSTRAEYAHLRYPLKAIQNSDKLRLTLIAGGAHTSPEYNHTIDLIKEDGFTVKTLEFLLSSDSDIGMAKSMSLASMGLCDLLGELRPDLLLLIADRYEMLAPATVATALRIPMAHIEGGDISVGAIDDAIRNAISKLAHIHFTPTQVARKRLLAMGEEDWRVHVSGAPSLDHLNHIQFLSRTQLQEKLQFNLETPLIIVAWHSLTLESNTLAETSAIFQALQNWQAGSLVFCSSNADAGGRAINQKAKVFCQNPKRLFVPNLDSLTYFSLLNQADAFIGNSSSGIMEAASFALPVLDIGKRQLGRTRGANVHTCDANPKSIEKGLETVLNPDFRLKIKNITNPYGQGDASSIILRVLEQLPDHQTLLWKQPVAIDQWVPQ